MEYKAKQGQTWDMISHEVYGDERYVQELITENPQYADVAVFDGGEIVKIPELEEDENDIWS